MKENIETNLEVIEEENENNIEKNLKEVANIIGNFKDVGDLKKELKETLYELGVSQDAISEYQNKGFWGKVFSKNQKWENQALGVYNALRLNFLLHSESAKLFRNILILIREQNKKNIVDLKEIFDLINTNGKNTEEMKKKLQEFKEEIELNTLNSKNKLEEYFNTVDATNKEKVEELKDAMMPVFEGLFSETGSLSAALADHYTQIIDLREALSIERKRFEEKNIELNEVLEEQKNYIAELEEKLNKKNKKLLYLNLFSITIGVIALLKIFL